MAALAMPIRIPLVVQVVWRTQNERISKAQVDSQVEALNLDYRARNADKSNVPAIWSGLTTDAFIEFALAARDPIGDPTAGGLPETPLFCLNGCSSNQPGLRPSDKYLNLWVCTLGGGLLGYAQFPGGPAATDGVVILNAAFGTTGTATAPFNLGRTSTHEIGHWLNLRHIWGDTEDCTGADFVEDTPNAQHPNFGRPEFPHILQQRPSGICL
jgi:hypothetical protein